MKNWRLSYTIVMVAMFSTILTGLPLISGTVRDHALLIRGFNLMEFSALACVWVVAPMTVALIVLSSQPKAVKEFEIILLTIVSLMCYTHAVQEARVWIFANEGSLLKYHPGVVFAPGAVVFEVVLWFCGGIYLKYRSIYQVDKNMARVTFLLPRHWVDEEWNDSDEEELPF